MRQTASGLRWSLPCPEANWVCPDSSWSAELEAGSDFKDGSARCSVRVFERYSVVGGDRMELRLSGTEYGQLAEGDTGRLSFQDTRYLGFERN